MFLEFAPIERRHDAPLSARSARADRPGAPSHGQLLDLLDANLEVFPRESAQVLEYWLDASRFARWKREALVKIPWNREIYLDDLRAYAQRGIRSIRSFAVWVDGEYVRRFGPPPIEEYGKGLSK